METWKKMMTLSKTYLELMSFSTFEDRFKYLQTKSRVGDISFGGHRMVNQVLYASKEWKKTRREIIMRDNGFDLAHPDYPIGGYIYIHHINPISESDILERRSCVFDPNNLISVSFQTHNAIHYGIDAPRTEYVERRPNDTCPWK